VPADYEKIRTENIARYGWDTAVLDLLGHLYSERTHFIFELIQNAEDAGATDLVFDLFDDRLELRHDGRPFNEADVRGVCGVAATSKSGDLTKIGRFGIGFKSVYAYTNNPRIYSGDETFRIENYVRPVAIARPAEREPGEPRAGDLGTGGPGTGGPGTGGPGTGGLYTGDLGTLVVFPFDLASVPAPTAAAEIGAALTAIDPETLLFLRSIKRLRVGGFGVEDAVLTRATTRHSGTGRRVTLRTHTGRRADEFLVWQRSLADKPGLRVEIAFRTAPDRDGTRRIVRHDGSRLVVYFPTEKQTQLGFLVHGPYRTTPARDNVPEHNSSNQALVRETAALLADVLGELRDQSLLTAEVLRALPIDEAQFGPGTMFRPLFDAVRAAMRTEALVPVGGGRYGAAAGLKLARGAGLRELFTPDQVGAVYGESQPVEFVDEAITPESTPLPWQYLRDEIGIEEITPSSLVGMLTAEFLEAQPDDWIADLYGFLYGHAALWREPGAWEPADQEPGIARARPVIRLEDGTQVRPFHDDGRAAVYLPGTMTTPFPAVRRSIASVAAARQFLTALGLTEPDIVDEVLAEIFPRYGRTEVGNLDAAQHESDIEVVARAMTEAGGDRRERLLGQLAETAFLVGENAATGERRLMTPGSLYQRSKELELYFDGNAEAWFAADGYGPWLAQLRAMGVHGSVQVRARPRDPLGYVVIADEFARHERGVEGFDPTAEIDGLQFALSRPSHARAEYIWNVLLVPNAHLVAGVVETSHREAFVDAQLSETLSTIGVVATAAAWLPGPDGSWRRPAEVRLDQLPSGFSRDETLARFLGMAQSVVEAAARQLGLSADLLRALSEHPDLVTLVERELNTRTSE
jgi:hypothetical protein